MLAALTLKIFNSFVMVLKKKYLVSEKFQAIIIHISVLLLYFGCRALNNHLALSVCVCACVRVCVCVRACVRACVCCSL